MKDFDAEFKLLIERFQTIPAVVGLVLGGSRARETADNSSDYDLYVYCNPMLTTQERGRAYHNLFSSLELNNRYWETEDNAVFLDCAVSIDIIFREANWIENELAQRLDRYIAHIGYTTCIVESIATGIILFDRSDRFARLQAKAQGPYPRQLAQNIINKNQPLLRSSLVAYRGQILQAFERGDRIGVNHRVAAFLASLFDVLFALNLKYHPGEKRLIEQAVQSCRLKPAELRPLVDRLLSSAASTDLRRGKSEAAFAIDGLCDQLDAILAEAELLPESLA